MSVCCVLCISVCITFHESSYSGQQPLFLLIQPWGPIPTGRIASSITRSFLPILLPASHTSGALWGSAQPPDCITASVDDKVPVFPEGRRPSHPRRRPGLFPLNHGILWPVLAWEGEGPLLKATNRAMPALPGAAVFFGFEAIPCSRVVFSFHFSRHIFNGH